MSKKEELLIFDEFKNIEGQLVDALSIIPEQISEEGKDSEKDNIQSYINKVIKAKKLFNRYEELANKLNEMNNKNENDQDSIEISKKVIDSRKVEGAQINEKELLSEFKAMEKQSKGLEKVEIETMGGTVIVKKKKGSGSSSAKEM